MLKKFDTAVSKMFGFVSLIRTNSLIWTPFQIFASGVQIMEDLLYLNLFLYGFAFSSSGFDFPYLSFTLFDLAFLHSLAMWPHLLQ